MNTLEVSCRDESAKRLVRGRALNEVVLTNFDPFNPVHREVYVAAQYAVAMSDGHVVTHSVSPIVFRSEQS